MILTLQPSCIQCFWRVYLESNFTLSKVEHQFNVLRKHHRNGFFRAEHPNDNVDGGRHQRDPLPLDGKRVFVFDHQLMIISDPCIFLYTFHLDKKTGMPFAELSRCFSLYGIPKKECRSHLNHRDISSGKK